MPLSQPQLLSIIITPMVTGSISTVASATIIVSIFRSNVKLSTIYRRFIFAISVFDVLQSILQGLSTIPMPADDVYWGSSGNAVTCGLQGFTTVLGVNGVSWYNLSLTIYFLLVVKFEIPEAKIKKKYEPFLHAIPILYALSISIFVYATGNYNPSGPICWIDARLANCNDNPETPCESIVSTGIMKLLAGAIAMFVVGSFNMIGLVLIWWTMRRKMKESQNRRRGWARIPTPNTQGSFSTEGDNCRKSPLQRISQLALKCWSKIQCRKEGAKNTTTSTPTSSALADRLSRPSQVATNRMREISQRAIFFILAFLATYLFSIIYRVIEIFSSNPAPYIIVFLSRLLFPLQGFFNMLVFTYPHVQSYRRNHENTSYFHAFVHVIKSGGDSDQVIAKKGRPGRRHSLRKQQKILEQCENKRRDSITDWANNGRTANVREMDVPSNFRTTRLLGGNEGNEEMKMDIDEEMKEERLIENLHGIKPKHPSIATRKAERNNTMKMLIKHDDCEANATNNDCSTASELAINIVNNDDGNDDDSDLHQV